MSYKDSLINNNWHFGPKLNHQTKPPTPIFNILVSPVSPQATIDCGAKVEELETTEKTVRLLLRRKHIYLIRVKHTYKLKEIIFHNQIQRNWNRRKGYPENRNLRPRINPEYISSPEPVSVPDPVELPEVHPVLDKLEEAYLDFIKSNPYYREFDV